MTLAAGARLGPYEILSPIGAGGMGEVYKARDTRLQREVAIKVLPSGLSADPDRLRRFEQEARAAGLLNHPNVTTVYDVGEHDGAPYVVQELLEGETLRSVLARGSLSPREAIGYAAQIAHGLSAAHQKGILHRDLKPENLFLTEDGRIKILDFGLAKLVQPETPTQEQTGIPTQSPGTESGVVLGTVGYMSPEQVRGKPADVRSDLFAFGAVLYEMLAGRRAFTGESAADAMLAVLKDDPLDRPTASRTFPLSSSALCGAAWKRAPSRDFNPPRTSGSNSRKLPPPRRLAGPASPLRAVFGMGSGSRWPALPSFWRPCWPRTRDCDDGSREAPGHVASRRSPCCRCATPPATRNRSTSRTA